MQKTDALVVGALEVGQVPVPFEILKSFLPADHVFLELWPRVADRAILHPLQALNLVERLDSVLDQPGDVIECGIYQGVTSVLMASLMELRESGKKLLLFDSFQGLPEPDRQLDASPQFRKGAWSASRQDVEALLVSHRVMERCEIHEGWFTETLSGLGDDQQFCFAYIDADIYSSTVDCLGHLWPRMDQGSVAVFDDYHHPSGGVRQALDEWLANTGEVIHVGPASQCFVIRGQNPASEQIKCHRLQVGDQKEILLSFDYLGRNRLFCELVDRRLKYLRSYESQLAQFASLLENRVS